MKTPQKVGFVGLGKMGYPMAIRLAGADFALTVFDINRMDLARDLVAGFVFH